MCEAKVVKTVSPQVIEAIQKLINAFELFQESFPKTDCSGVTKFMHNILDLSDILHVVYNFVEFKNSFPDDYNEYLNGKANLQSLLFENFFAGYIVPEINQLLKRTNELSPYIKDEALEDLETLKTFLQEFLVQKDHKHSLQLLQHFKKENSRIFAIFISFRSPLEEYCVKAQALLQ